MFDGGSYFQAGLAYLGQRETNKNNKQIADDATQASAAEAQKNRDFQENMSSSAYQRAMADMKKAGLNPMLAYQQGGASTPSGATGQAFTAQMENELGAGVSTAQEARRLKKDIELAGSQTAVNAATTAAKETESALNQANAKVAHETAKQKAIMTPAIAKTAKVDAMRAEYDEKYMAYDQVANRVGQGTGIISNAVNAIPGLGKIKIGGGDNMPKRPAKGTIYDSDTKSWYNKRSGEIHE